MLETLRKNASGWFAKILLGGIALIFALYFGFSGGGGPPQGGTAPIAKVNGQNIPSGLFNQTVANQIEVYQKFGVANQTPELQQVIQSQVLQRLIQETLFAQEATRLGLHVTDVELANAIRNNPSFQRDGRFDETFYLKQFKPYFERQNGENFEYSLREDLLVERFRQVLGNAIVVSQNQVKAAEKISQTQLKFLQLAVPFGTDGETKSQEEAKKLVQDWIQARQTQQPTEKLLKDNGLSEEEVGPKPLKNVSATFGTAEGSNMVACLLAQGIQKVCPQAFTVNNKVIAVELQNIEEKVTEAAPTDMVDQMTRAKEAQLMTGVTDLLTRGSKIETYLTQ